MRLTKRGYLINKLNYEFALELDKVYSHVEKLPDESEYPADLKNKLKLRRNFLNFNKKNYVPIKA